MKNEIIKRNITQDKEFYWTECSGSIERLYEKHNGIKIPNEYAFDILQTPMTLLDDGYHYERVIKGETQKKVIYGFFYCKVSDFFANNSYFVLFLRYFHFIHLY